MFFSVITTNLIWEILFLNNGTGLRMKNFNVIGFTKIAMFGFTEKSNFWRGVQKTYIRGNYLKAGRLGQFADLGGEGW